MGDRTHFSALVVDDSASIRRQLAELLEGVGARVIEANDGAEAWRRLQVERLDILLTDINMPVMDGLKLVRLVRSSGAHQHAPIVVITTEGAEVDRRRALDLGADAYLLKPVQSEELVETVTRLLRRGPSAG